MPLIVLLCLLAGCVHPISATSPPGGCLELRHGRKGSYLVKNGEMIRSEIVEATAGDPAAQKLALQSENEMRAAFGFIAAVPALLLGAVVSIGVGTDRPKHLEPWAQATVPSLVAGELLTIGIVTALASASTHSERKAIERFNQDNCR